MLLYEFLIKNAKYYDPKTYGSGYSINRAEIDELANLKLTHTAPLCAFREDSLVDDLLVGLKDYLGERQIDDSDMRRLHECFNHIISEQWSSIHDKGQARSLFSFGPERTVHSVMQLLGFNVMTNSASMLLETRAVVDMVYSVGDGDRIKEAYVLNPGVVVEFKKPAALDRCDTVREEDKAEGLNGDREEGMDEDVGGDDDPELESEEGHIPEVKESKTWENIRQGFGQRRHFIKFNGPHSAFERLMSKMSSYMTLSNSHWAIVTSFHKYVFLRRLENPSVLLYSTVERQEDNTRPFCAFLAMMLAIAGQINIPPPPEGHISLPVKNLHLPRSQLDSVSVDPCILQEENRSITREKLIVPHGQLQNDGEMAHGLEIRWASSLLPNGDIAYFKAVPGTEELPSLGNQLGPIRLQLHRFWGLRYIGVAYSASLDHHVDSSDHSTETINGDLNLSHIVKIVVKGNSPRLQRQITALRHEFKMYQKIERARSTGAFHGAIPRCYGLYESKYSLVLLLEYVGEPIDNFDEVTPKGRATLKKTVLALH